MIGRFLAKTFASLVNIKLVNLNHWMPLLGVVLSFCHLSVVQASDVFVNKKPDVRLVIDVSGSMKKNDPNNLRRPAVDLLVKMLPEDSKAGVWTFGKWVNMLIPLKPVEEGWRQNAQTQAQKIDSVALYTNIGLALDKATYDYKTPKDEFNTSLILLTDGMVDIDKDTAANEKEWRRIVDEIIPRVKEAGYTIHTVALSDNADAVLLDRLAVATGGIAATAHTADDLMKIFLQAFDASVPSEQVPLDGNHFKIDSSVEEFTALIFRQYPEEFSTLVAPNKKQYRKGAPHPEMSWYRGDNYDLVTIKHPLEGRWNIEAVMDPSSRVTVVSNLNLRVKPLPFNVLLNEPLNLDVGLFEEGQLIEREAFLSLLAIETDLSRIQIEPGDELGASRTLETSIWSQVVDAPDQAGVGRYTLAVEKSRYLGQHRLQVRVDGKSFERHFSHTYEVRAPFLTNVHTSLEEGVTKYALQARVNDPRIEMSVTQVVATVISPSGDRQIMPLELTPRDFWESPLALVDGGRYRASVRFNGFDKQGEKIRFVAEDIEFDYSPGSGVTKANVEESTPEFTVPPEEESAVPEAEPVVDANPVVLEEAPQIEAVVPAEAPMTEPNIEPKPVVEPVKAALPVAPVPAVGDEASAAKVSSTVFFGALGLGTLLLLGLVFLIYRKISSDDPMEAVNMHLAALEDTESATQVKAEGGGEAEAGNEVASASLSSVADNKDMRGDDQRLPESAPQIDEPGLEVIASAGSDSALAVESDPIPEDPMDFAISQPGDTAIDQQIQALSQQRKDTPSEQSELEARLEEAPAGDANTLDLSPQTETPTEALAGGDDLEALPSEESAIDSDIDEGFESDGGFDSEADTQAFASLAGDAVLDDRQDAAVDPVIEAAESADLPSEGLHPDLPRDAERSASVTTSELLQDLDDEKTVETLDDLVEETLEPKDLLRRESDLEEIDRDLDELTASAVKSGAALDDIDDVLNSVDRVLGTTEGLEAEEDESSVAAMIRANGLDLGEDELDDAINSLIEEAEGKPPSSRQAGT